MGHYSTDLPLPLICNQGLRVALAGPGSIETAKWTSRSRANQFGLILVPRPLAVLVMTIVGLLNSCTSLSDPQLVILSCAGSWQL